LGECIGSCGYPLITHTACSGIRRNS
jgi:hypothetical protein